MPQTQTSSSGAGFFSTDTLIVFLLLWFCSGYFNHNQGWNENSRFDLTFAIVEQHRLIIDSYHELPDLATGDKSFYQGHYYSDKAIGTSLLGVLAYAPIHGLNALMEHPPSIFANKWIITWLTVGLLFATCGTLFYLICREHMGHGWQACALTLCLMLGTMCFPYSTVFVGHQIVGALLFLCFFLLYQGKRQRIHSRRRLLLVGGLLGMAVITEYTAVLLSGLIMAYAAYVDYLALKRLSAPRLLGMLGIFAAPIALHLGYNLACFGRITSIGYANLDHPLFQAGVRQGILGISWPRPSVLYYLTLHPAYGLFWQSPVLLLSGLGAYRMLRSASERIEALLCIGMAGAYLAMNAGYFYWWGGWSFGPRYLIPIVPFLGLLLIHLPKRWLGALWALGLISIGQMLIVASSTIHVPDANIPVAGQPFFGFSAIYSYCLAQLRQGKLAPNLGTQLGLSGRSSLLLAALVVCVGSLGIWRRFRLRALREALA